MIHPAVLEWVLASEKGKPSRGALWHAIKVMELHSMGCQRIDVWRFDSFGTVASNPLFAQVIDHDEHHVERGTLLCLANVRPNCGRNWGNQLDSNEGRGRMKPMKGGTRSDW